ncbi:DNA alkylation repair protein [Nodosilinea sp. E11]|uniref:DNA alkylation repair protein n=1 Tax=Nodosilinea sp. E11 TaxID=3037479 RepID=UPI002934A493|nr:DNA alkylation repair protein [Nodosilinea sp. E11]WOD39948.1 DNA alkylation repair protein [Nodosilinea sp. E11]
MSLAMDTYLHNLRRLFESQANPDRALPMKQYMRNQFEYLGIQSPQQKVLLKQFISDYGLPERERLDSVVRELWDWPAREYQYAALTFLDKLQKQLAPDVIPLLHHLIVTKSWWDTVDSIASHHVGKLLKQYPDIRDDVIDQWRKSDNLWLRRTTILFQLGYKGDTDESLLFSLIRENQADTEFFIQKAIGWALREYSKTAPDAVLAFVEQEHLAALSKREALKWMKSKETIHGF